MSQFAEVRDDMDTLDHDLTVAIDQVDALELTVAEQAGQASEDARRIAAIQADTNNRGRAIRSCLIRNGELEELNALLTDELEKKRSASGAEQAALLAELQRIRADLQFQEDSLLTL